MSTQSIIAENNLPTGQALNRVLAEVSTDLLKELRFEIRKVPKNKMLSILRLQRLYCSEHCYINSEQNQEIREHIIKEAVTKIREL